MQGSIRREPAGRSTISRGAARGAVAAMAMTGMRDVTVELGLVRHVPPTTFVRQKARGLLACLSPGERRAAVELFHWTYGMAGGVAFGLLPKRLRQKRWIGPAYGFAVWLGFEVALAPLLGLRRPHLRPVTERVALAADHMLYGLVLAQGD